MEVICCPAQSGIVPQVVPARVRKKASYLCCTPHCRNKRAKDYRVCWKCHSRKFREAHPIAAAYRSLKDRAKQRGHQFELTLLQFEIFCLETDYIARRGKTAESLSIDRIKGDEPYRLGNLQVLTLAENSRKSYHDGSRAPLQTEIEPTDEDRPF